MSEFLGKRVTVAGLGHFGGNIAASRWLCEQGARVVVTDLAPAEKLTDATSQLADLPIAFTLGGHNERDFIETDLVVASPAIPPTNRYLQLARQKGVPLTTEICLFVERCPSPMVIGITGTKGKSTTTAMLGAILSAHFPRVWVGGNIGRSLLSELRNIQPGDPVVVELSSFMLHYLREMRWSPRIGIMTMLTSDHLDWHGSREAYIADKAALFEFMSPEQVAVIPRNALVEQLAQRGQGRIVPFGGAAVTLEVGLPGLHNQMNAEAAAVAAGVLGVDRRSAQAALREFRGLPHRLQLVHEADGVRYFNDSIATIPDAAVAAMDSFPQGTVIHIVGGSDKGLDVHPMCQALAERARAVMCIGTTGKVVHDLIRAINRHCHVEHCGDLVTAVRRAKAIALAGDTILLSPGFASYDQFTNFQHRGEAFTEAACGHSVSP